MNTMKAPGDQMKTIAYRIIALTALLTLTVTTGCVPPAGVVQDATLLEKGSVDTHEPGMLPRDRLSLTRGTPLRGCINVSASMAWGDA